MSDGRRPYLVVIQIPSKARAYGFLVAATSDPEAVGFAIAEVEESTPGVDVAAPESFELTPSVLRKIGIDLDEWMRGRDDD